MTIRRLFMFVSAIAAFALAASCGGGGGGGDEPGTSYGDDLNSGYEAAELSCTGTTFGGTWSSGAFTVTVPADAMSPCVNATSPIAAADAALPAGFDVRTGEVNATSGGASYTFTVGERGFQNSADANQVTVVVPFDPALIADPLKKDSLHVFVRFFNPEDGSLVDAIGDVNPDNTVTVLIEGLPPSVTAAVIYNPNMAYFASAAASTSVSAPIKETPYTWGAAHWCVLYSTTDQAVVDAFNTYKLTYPTATMQDMVDDEIAANAVIGQDTYVAVPFRQPAMIITAKANHPCGDTLATNPRSYIHLEDSGTQFLPNAEQELFQTYVPVVNSDGNYYGRIYIQPEYINTPPTDFLYPILSTVAHEMFHAIQYGYDMVTWNRTVQGYVEGPATTYGRTIGLNPAGLITTPEVRGGTGETFLLDRLPLAELAQRDQARGCGRLFEPGLLRLRGAQVRQRRPRVPGEALLAVQVRHLQPDRPLPPGLFPAAAFGPLHRHGRRLPGQPDRQSHAPAGLSGLRQPARDGARRGLDAAVHGPDHARATQQHPLCLQCGQRRGVGQRALFARSAGRRFQDR